MAIPGFKGISLKAFGKQFYQRFMDSDLSGIAAELSYYFLFSIFPCLVFLVTLTPYLPIQDAVDLALVRLSTVMPKSAMDVIQSNLQNLLTTTRPKLLSFGIFITLWSASRGVSAFINGLNIAYGVKDRRSYFKVQAIAVAGTLANTFLLLIAFALIILGGRLGMFIAERLHMGHFYAMLGSWLRWPIGAFLVMTAVALNYYYLPDVKQKFRWISPGSVIGTVLWLVGTWGFTLYAEHFGDYNTAYGSIGGVMVLMIWLYFSGLTFLIGGAVNAILDELTGLRPPPEPAEQAAAAAPRNARQEPSGAA